MSEKPKKTFDQKVIEYHPKFLEAIRETYPLAVLGSLCIAIAAFTTKTYPDIQTYALSAASLLLIAFAFSFIMKFLPSVYFALGSYVAAGLGALFIFLAIGSFTQAIPVIGTSITLVTDIPIIFMNSSFLFLITNLRKTGNSNKIRLLTSYVTIPLGVIVITLFVINLIAKILPFDMPSPLTVAYTVVMAAFFALSLGSLIYNMRLTKKQIREQSHLALTKID